MRASRDLRPTCHQLKPNVQETCSPPSPIMAKRRASLDSESMGPQAKKSSIRPPLNTLHTYFPKRTAPALSERLPSSGYATDLNASQVKVLTGAADEGVSLFFTGSAGACPLRSVRPDSDLPPPPPSPKGRVSRTSFDGSLQHFEPSWLLLTIHGLLRSRPAQVWQRPRSVVC